MGKKIVWLCLISCSLAFGQDLVDHSYDFTKETVVNQVYENQIPLYYQSVDFSLNGLPLKNVLEILVTNTHTYNLSYSQVWNALKEADSDVSNLNNVVLIYGWENEDVGIHARTRSKSLKGGSSGDWNREHVYPKSLGNPNLGTSGAGADAHHIRPCDVQWNSVRGNKKFTDGSGNSGTVDGKWYPGDEWKGDVARMAMYMYLRYNTRCLPTNVGVGSTSATPDGMIDLFLEWNVQDPVSELEIQRNEYLSSNGDYAQGNRNPFVDNPYLATKIWGGPEAQNTWGSLIDSNVEQVRFGMYPNPTQSHNVFLSSAEVVATIKLFSMDGRLIHEINNPVFIDDKYEIENLNSGFYLVQLITVDNKKETKKLLVN